MTPFPAEFAARYRALGYWEDRPLFDGFRAALAAHADRVAVIDEAGSVTYGQLEERSEHLARVLLDAGVRPGGRIVVQLPNTAVFAYLYFALLRFGAPPVLALPGHRRREIGQFASISGAVALAVPATARGFDVAAMAADVMTDRPELRLCLIQGLKEAPNDPRFLRLEDLLHREPETSREALDEIRIDPADPALFLLSGGTTGIPKLIPRTHNDYLRAERALPGCFIQENFGMAEGLIMFVRSSDPPQVRRETCGRPASPADEVYLVDQDGDVVPDGEPGELIVRGPYPDPVLGERMSPAWCCVPAAPRCRWRSW
ncbi:MAG TPA: AMP-binding protein [Streptosporangiaceae bacterium]|nr:AMP-binding protein [Streptosporangiaceae bacterium]